jgi:hypothetical protein
MDSLNLEVAFQGSGKAKKVQSRNIFNQTELKALPTL